MRKRNCRWIGSITILFILPLLALFASCATIPSEAPELSAELGNRIAEIEKSHINLLRRFFDEKREHADKHVFEVWLPLLAEKVFDDPRTQALWKRAVDSDDPQDRVQFIIWMGPKIQERINAKRNELHNALDQFERLTERELRDAYLQARAINNSLTSFLTSASKVEKNRERLLKIILRTATGQIMHQAVDGVASTVSKFLIKAETEEETVELTEAFKKNLKELAESLFKRGEQENGN